MGSSKSHTMTLTNNGSASVTISKAVRTDPSFSSTLSVPVTLAAGQSKQFVVTFTPKFIGHVSAAFVYTTNVSNTPLDLYVRGAGQSTSQNSPGTLVPSPSSLSFSGVQVGSNQTLPETLSNTGGSGVTLSSTNVTGSQFSITAPGMPMTLAPGHSVTLNVTFTPTTSKTVTGDVSVASTLPNLTIPLSGSAGATGSLSVTPGALNFGQVTVGSSANLTGKLTASGASVTISAASVTSNEYSLSGISFPVTIAAGKSVSFTATFAPQSTGGASANFTFTGSTSQASESLSGTGTAAATHSVGLSWQPSSSSVEGYNVYRGSGSSGPYSKLTASVDDNTSYTDTTVQSGNTYYYVTTAVGTDGVESGYSNQVKAVIP